MTKKNDSTRKAGFVAAQPSTTTAAEWLQMERAFNVAGHKHSDLEAYWTLHDKMLSTPAPNWQALAFKAVLLSCMSPGFPDPSDPEERAYHFASNERYAGEKGTAVIALYDAALRAARNGDAASVDSAIANVAKLTGVLDPTDRANVAAIASATASVRKGEVNPAEINKALLAMHFDVAALSKIKPEPAPVDTRSLAQRLAHARRLRDEAEDLPGLSDDEWTGAPLAREADALEHEIDVAPCLSPEDAVAKLEAILDVVMRKDGDLQDAAGTEARSLRSVVEFLRGTAATPSPGYGPEVAAVAAAHSEMMTAADQSRQDVTDAAAEAVSEAEERLIASRAGSLGDVIFKLRCALLGAGEAHDEDGTFPGPVNAAAIFAPWAADARADTETRFVASAILDLAALSGRSPLSPSALDTEARRLRRELERLPAEIDQLAKSRASDADLEALDSQERRAEELADQLPCTSPATAAAKLTFALTLIRIAESSYINRDDERVIRDVIAWLDSAEADDAALIALGDEFERRWAVERALFDGQHTDEQHGAATEYTAEIVREIETKPPQTLAGCRVWARAITWAHGDDSDFHDALSNPQTCTNDRITARLMLHFLGLGQ